MQQLPDALAPLAAYRQFVVYQLVPSTTRPGKMDKYPCDTTGRVSNAHDPAIWTDANTATAAAATLGQQYGVGFVFTELDPFWFLDIDECYNGQWSDVANYFIQAFPGVAVEVSSSGRGLHLIGSGRAPAHGMRNAQYHLEFYTEKRFVALTGTHATGSAATDCSQLLPWLVQNFFPYAPGQDDTEWTTGPDAEWNGPTDDDDLLRRALRSQSAGAAFGNRASFADLFEGKIEALAKAYPDDAGRPFNASQADAALAQHLAFWTGKDCERIDRLMRRSALVRDKWDRRGDNYLHRTILQAVAKQREVLIDKAPEPLAAAAQSVAGKAPEATLVTGSTFLTISQQMELFKGCVYILDQNRALTPGGLLLKPEQFRVMYGGYCFPMDNANERTSRDAWEAFTQSQAFRSPRADGTCFKPSREPGEIIHDAGRTRANAWWPVKVPRQKGDPTPFLNHLEKLLPDPRDREIVLSYMCACVQHKGVKFQWAPLLQGTEGNGKTLLARCVAEAIGKRYVHWPKASKLSAQFNAWMLNKLFYGVEDIYVAGARIDVINELRPMITGEDLEIEGKGVDQISAEICGNFMFNSNHKDAILKTRNDRRFAVFFTPQQSPEDLKRDGMVGDYFQKLYDWLKLENGYAIVSELLHTRPILHEFNPAAGCQRAPLTTSTEEAIAESLGTIEQEILEAIDQNTPGFMGGWVSSTALGKLLDEMRGGRKMSNTRKRDIMATLGYIYHPGLKDGRLNNPVFPDGNKPRLFIKQDHPSRHLTDAAAIAQAYSAAQGVTPKLPY